MSDDTAPRNHTPITEAEQPTPDASHPSPVTDLAILPLRPPVMLDRETTLGEAARRMYESGVSAVLVGGATRHEGIVTERDVTRQLAERGASAHVQPLWRVMTPDVISIASTASTGEAMLRMLEHGIRHLLVTGVRARDAGSSPGMGPGSDEPLAILEERDLLAADAESPLAIAAALDIAADATSLATAHTRLHGLTLRCAREGTPAVRLGRVMGGLRDRLVHRAACLAQADMPTPPPAPFAVGVLGSQARREQFFATDQDVALIVSDASGDIPPEEVDAWFSRYGSRFALLLEAAGLPPCPHGIMPSSPGWRRGMAGWRAVVDDACRTPDAEGVLTLSILADLRGVGDDFALCRRLRTHLAHRTRETALPLRLMAREAARHTPRLGLFNRLPVAREGADKGCMDLKRCGLFAVTQGVRTLALDHDLTEDDTAARIAALRDGDALGGELGSDLAHAWEVLLAFRLRAQSIQMSSETVRERLAGAQDARRHTGDAAQGTQGAQDMLAPQGAPGQPGRCERPTPEHPAGQTHPAPALLHVASLAPLERDSLRRCLVVVAAFVSFLESRYGLHLIG